MAIAALLFVPLAFLIVLVVGSMLLRGGISLANRILGPQSAEVQTPIANEFNQQSHPAPPTSGNPFAAPVAPSKVPNVAGRASLLAIPEPSFGKAMGMVALASFINFAVQFGIEQVLFKAFGEDPGVALLGSLLNLVISFGIYTIIVSQMAPTSFGRACPAVLMMYLIAFAIVMAVVAVAFAVGIGAGAMGP